MHHAAGGRKGTFEATAFEIRFYGLSMVGSFHEFRIRLYARTTGTGVLWITMQRQDKSQCI
jgi:hypothetical protein